MKLTLAAVVAASFSLACAAPALNARHVQHERRDQHHDRAVIKRGPIAPTMVLPIRVGLTQRNLHLGHDMLMEVSDPRSAKYGQHYTAEEVHDFFAPSQESVGAVRAWIADSGIAAERVSLSANKQWLQLDAFPEEAEALVKTKFHVYEDTVSGKISVGCDEYHVRVDIQQHIDYITPGVRMVGLSSGVQGMRKRQSGPAPKPLPEHSFLKSSSLEYCKSRIIPDCIAAMYNISTATSAVKGNALGIFEETGENLEQEDLNAFFTSLATQIPNNTFPTVHLIDGAVNENGTLDGAGESTLDFEIAYPIVYPQNPTMFLTNDAESISSPGLYNTFLDAIDGSYCNYSAFGETGNNNTVDPVYPNSGYTHSLQCGVFKPTNVISFSYGQAEIGLGIPMNYQQRQCSEYMKLGLQGISIVFSSGDAGVGGREGCLGENGTVFSPDFPPNCPYVTAVGATTLTGSAAKDEERAVTQFPSGGGFSNFFARPSYQEDAVKAFFKSADAPTYPYYTGSEFGNGLYNRSGRAYPDVSAIGQNIVNFRGGRAYLNGGTSASAPTFASILSRINEERLKAGKSTIGFVNPTLYSNPHVFHDITVGSNPACGSAGFQATKGWDPVTGLGTPNYPALLDVFMGISSK